MAFDNVRLECPRVHAFDDDCAAAVAAETPEE